MKIFENSMVTLLVYLMIGEFIWIALAVIEDRVFKMIYKILERRKHRKDDNIT